MKARSHFLVRFAALGLLGSIRAFAQVPTGPHVVAGQVGFAQGPGAMTLTQTSRNAIVNWQTFNIGAADQLRLVQPDASAAMLARVTGGTPSLLQGALKADGKLFLVNPQGIVIGRDGVIDAAAFVASTRDVSDADFLRGSDLTFAGTSDAAIVNLGTIAARTGNVFLFAQSVTNAGSLSAPNGTVGLGAGSEIHLASADAPSFEVKLDLGAAAVKIGVDNSGVIAAAQAQLEAAGGSIYGLAVNDSGVIRATGVENKDGRVLLTAGAGTVNVSGEISAQNDDGSGGDIFVGGGYQGKDSAIANAANTVVSSTATLDASASGASGNGGRIVVWSDDTTRFAGNIAARGGSNGGDGGVLEVSGKHQLDFTGRADTSAPAGKRGSLLLDPNAVIISTDPDQNIAGQGGFIQGQAVPSILNNGTLNSLLAATDVIVQAGDAISPPGYNGISVNADVGWSAATTLTLVSRDTIAINADINGGSTGNLTLKPGTVSAGDSTAGAITLDASKAITVNTLSIEKSNLASSNGTDIGAINLAGTVNATTVELVRDSGGVTGDVLINNAANQIGTLRGTGSDGAITGDLRVADSAGGLNVDGDFSGLSGAVEIVTTGDLTVNSGALVKNTGAADLVLAAQSGSFINNAGAAAIDASGAGRYLIYSDTPANTTRGGLTGLSAYDLTYAGNAPASITQTGDRFLFSLAPTLTFTADNLSKAAGAANPALTYTVTGLQAGDTLADAITGTPALSTTATTGSPAGSYPISIANGTLALTDMGYDLSLEAGALSVIANLLTISANNVSKIYGTANPAFTASYSGFNGDDDSSVVTGLKFSTTATTRSGVGTYTITPFGATASGYTINYVPGSLSITPTALTIRVNDLARTYGAANPVFTASYTGFVNGDTASVVSGLSLGSIATASSNVGSYPITAAGATAANYTITLTPGTLTVNKAPLTITAEGANRTYGAANPIFDGIFSGLVNGDSPSVVSGLSFSTTATKASPVGGYPITVSGGTATNYRITTDSGVLSVQPAPLTVTPVAASRFYGDANPVFSGTFTGFVNGETASVLTSQPTYFSAASVTSNVGNYAITASGGSAANYTLNYQPGTLTVAPAVLAVTADNLTRAYGDTNPTFTYSVSGLKNGDSADGKFFIFTLGSTTPVSAPVGNYNIQLTGNDTPNDNYATFFAGGTLTVHPRPLTIRTDAVSREYGLANPAFTATFTGLASFDSPSAIPNLGFTTIATTASGVGDYTVMPTAGTNSNYAITLLPNLLHITPAPLTVFGGGSLTRIYGDANPVFTPFITAGTLRNGDTVASIGLSVGSTATQSSSVGTYALTPTLTSANYSLTAIDGSLSIMPAVLDVTVGNATRVYGDANPLEPTITATGLKLADTAASVVSLLDTITPQTGVGSYSLSAASSTPNYLVRSVTAGTLNITPRPVTVTVNGAERIYGDANPVFTATVGGRGLASFDPMSALVAGIDTTTPTSLLSPVGFYVLNPVLAGNPNYIVTNQQNGVLQITPRPLTITMPNLARYYYDPNPATLTPMIGGAGLAPFNTLTDLFNFAGILPSQTADVGNYGYLPKVRPNSNYAITVTGGNLTIVPRPVQITVNSLIVADGAAIPAFTAQFAGLPDGVSAQAAFPDLVFYSGTTAPTPQVRPAPVLVAYTPPPPPAPVYVDSTTVDADGNIRVVSPITPITISLPADPVEYASFPLPTTLTIGNTTKSFQTIWVDGYNSNPNYAVTGVTFARLTLTTSLPPDPAIAEATAAATTPLTVETGDPSFGIPGMLRDSQMQPYLQQAAEELKQRMIASGDQESLNKYFNGGVDAFLAGLADNPEEQALLTGVLADVVLSYALLPRDQQPAALIPLIDAAMKNAQQVKFEQAQQVAALYDQWLQQTDYTQNAYFSGTDVPNFAKQVRVDYAKDAAIVVGAGLGSAAAGTIMMAAMPVGIITSGTDLGIGSMTALGAAVAAGDVGATTAGIASTGPIGASIMAAVGIVVRGVQLVHQSEIKASIATAQALAATGDPAMASIDFSNKNDLECFSEGFIRMMSTIGY
ncbi:MAG TPA: MBG domain-containing protein [Opitutus sp.]|nr:MBG domain-containing protein [Opitutus sp.]